MRPSTNSGSRRRSGASARFLLVVMPLVTLCARGHSAEPGVATTRAALGSRIGAFLSHIKQDQAKALEMGRKIAEDLESGTAEEPLLASLARIRAVEALADQVTEYLSTAQRKATLLLANELLASQTTKPSMTSMSRPARAAHLYRRYAPDFADALDANKLPSRTREFIAAYYNLVINTRMCQISRLGTAELCASPENSELQFYLLLLPLLHKSDAELSQADLAYLPEWMRRHEVLKRLFNFCVWQVERPRTGACLAKLIASASSPGNNDPVKVLRDAAVGTLDCGRTHLGLTLYQLAAEEAGGQTPRARELHLEAIRQLEAAKAWQLVAAECRAHLDRFVTVPDTERALVVATRLEALEKAKSKSSLVVELDRAMADEQMERQLPKLLPIKWRILRAEGKGEEAANVLRAFLTKFPRHPKAAEVYLQIAIHCIQTRSREDDARAILRLLRERFPKSSEAREAEALLERLNRAARRGNTGPPRGG